MKGICSSGKNFYHTIEEAEEALILHLGSHQYAQGTGPVNVYPCDFCEGYHFTSKGAAHPMLDNQKVKTRIAKLRQASDWENRF